MRTTAFRNVQSYSVTLHPQNRVQVTCTNDGGKPAFDGWTTPEEIQNPINGWTEFPEGQATFDKLNVILLFERKLLNTPVKIYLDKSPEFSGRLARGSFDAETNERIESFNWANLTQLEQADMLHDPHLQSPTPGAGNARNRRGVVHTTRGRAIQWHELPSLSRPGIKHRLTCGNAGTPTSAALVRDRYSARLRLEIGIDENWDWRVDRLLFPPVGSHRSAIAQSEFMAVYRESHTAIPLAFMRCGYVYDAFWSYTPNRRMAEITYASLDISSPVQLRYVWYVGTPKTGWKEIARTGQGERLLDIHGSFIDEKLATVPPEIAADIFEEHDENELANALRLQSGLFKKLGLNG